MQETQEITRKETYDELWEQSPPAKLNKRIMDTSLKVPIKSGDRIYLAGTVKLGKRELKDYLKSEYVNVRVVDKLEDATLIVFGIYANTAPYRPVTSHGEGYEFRHEQKFEVTLSDGTVRVYNREWHGLISAYRVYKLCREDNGEIFNTDDKLEELCADFYKQCFKTSYTGSFTKLPPYSEVVDKVEMCYNEFQLGVAMWKHSMSKRDVKLTEDILENILYMIHSSDNEVLANSYLTNMDITDYIGELMLLIGSTFRSGGVGDKAVFNAFSKSIPYVTYVHEYPNQIWSLHSTIIDQLRKAKSLVKAYDTKWDVDSMLDVYLDHVDKYDIYNNAKKREKKADSDGYIPYNMTTIFTSFISNWSLYVGFLSILPDDMLKGYIDTLPFAYLLDGDDYSSVEVSKKQTINDLMNEGAALRVYTALAHAYGIVSMRETPAHKNEYEFNNRTDNDNTNIAEKLIRKSIGYDISYPGIYSYRSRTDEEKLLEEHLPVLVTNFVVKNIDYMRSCHRDGTSGEINRNSVIKGLTNYSCLYRNIKNDRIQEYINQLVRDYVKTEVETYEERVIF